MQKLKLLKGVVLAELMENEKARSNDTMLLLGVFKRLGIDTSESFADLASKGQLRQMESITRCRRKIQQEHPELKDDTVAAIRNERQQIFKDFAKAEGL